MADEHAQRLRDSVITELAKDYVLVRRTSLVYWLAAFVVACAATVGLSWKSAGEAAAKALSDDAIHTRLDRISAGSEAADRLITKEKSLETELGITRVEGGIKVNGFVTATSFEVRTKNGVGIASLSNESGHGIVTVSDESRSAQLRPFEVAVNGKIFN